MDLLTSALTAVSPGDNRRTVLTVRLAEALRDVGEAKQAQQLAEATLRQTDDPDLIVELSEVVANLMFATGNRPAVAPSLTEVLARPRLTEPNKTDAAPAGGP